jgi:uncharacterized membrane protein
MQKPPVHPLPRLADSDERLDLPARRFSSSSAYPKTGAPGSSVVSFVRLPLRSIAALSLAMIAIHNLLDRISPLSFGRFAVLWSVLHCPGTYAVGSHYFFTLFTLIPWAGVMAAGYAFGPLLLMRDRRRVMLLLGATLTMAFFVLRALSLYGNSSAGLRPGFPDYLSAGPWTLQSSVALTTASFFNTLKHPASLQFLLMTLGPVLMTLAWLDNVNPKHGMARSGD